MSTSHTSRNPMLPRSRRVKCDDCGRRVVVRVDRFIWHTVYPHSIQYCAGSGMLAPEGRRA